jgi:hypothetical protein
VQKVADQPAASQTYYSVQLQDSLGNPVSESVTLTTTITAIDLADDTVTLRGPEGRSRTIKVREPADLRKVQVGDLVDITYSEAVAIAVRQVAKK